jgi:hypothetical protein
MRVGLLIHRLEQIERFEPVARRLPGARFCLPPGRWPSKRVDSRTLIARILAARGLPPVIQPRSDFDLVLSDGGLPEAATRAWLRPRGALVRWRDGTGEVDVRRGAPALILATGPALLPPDGTTPAQAVGDPLLDAVRESGARGRARSFLGLDGRPDRPVILVHADADGVDALAPALARLRDQAEIVVTVAWERRLAGGAVFPPALQGPGVARILDGPPRADLLAAADLVVADPGVFLSQAVAAGRAVVGCGRWRLRPGHPLAEGPSGAVLAGIEWVDGLADVEEALEIARQEPDALVFGCREAAFALWGEPDGQATRRVVQALQLLGPRQGAPLDPLSV